MKIKSAIFLFLAIAMSSWSLYAQEARATLSGRVMDPQGGLIPGAAVVVKNDDTDVKKNVKCNDKGFWIVEFLNPGTYELVVSAPGFTSERRTGIVLQTADEKHSSPYHPLCSARHFSTAAMVFSTCLSGSMAL